MKSISKIIVLFLSLFVAFSSQALGFKIEKVADGLGIPWAMAFLSPQQMIITERGGRARILNLQTGKLQALSGVPKVAARGQGGLLDVAIAPDYANSGWIYFTYSKPTDNGPATTLARAKLYASRLIDWQDLLITDSATDAGQHFGSRIAFDNRGHVFFGIGDRGERDNSQNLNNHAGSIIRLTVDGQVPSDNPFVGQSGKRDEIWSYGHRNPQGLVFDARLDKLWEIEHGPRGGDEINLISKGRNYGWPVTSHGKEYWAPISVGEGTEKTGIEPPHKVYIPSIAPSSLLLYNGEAFPDWNNSLFAGALKLQHLNRITINTNSQLGEEQRLLGDLNERIRALAQSPEGWIYFSTDSGSIYRIQPNN